MKNLTYILFTVLFSINYSMGQDPTISSFDTHVLCPDGGAPQMAISNIVFNSPNGDSTYITSVFFPTTAFNLDVLQNESSASHILLGTIVGGATGVFNIEVYYQSVSSSILSETIQVTVAEIPNISVNTASICNNLNEFDLNTLVNIQGGGF
ncbi:MAG TPA: hypothetical protein VFD77_00280 [Brumimicrobium sp.]|nr:hypothetical protein [Brumimicrobium sp.]